MGSGRPEPSPIDEPALPFTDLPTGGCPVTAWFWGQQAAASSTASVFDATPAESGGDLDCLLCNGGLSQLRLRRRIDALIAENATLAAMAQWVQHQTLVSPVPREAEVIRRMYWSTALRRAHPASWTITPAINRIRSHIQNSAPLSDLLYVTSNLRDLAYDLSRLDVGSGLPLEQAMRRLMPHAYYMLTDMLYQYARVPDYPLIRDHTLADLIPLLQAMIRHLHAHPGFELLQAFADYLHALTAWSKGSCYPGLDTALSAIILPDIDAGAAEWDALQQEIGDLVALIDDQIGWTFSASQTARLEQYFQAVNALDACLNTSCEYDREAIRGSLMLPPGEWQLLDPQYIFANRPTLVDFQAATDALSAS
jgi:hypothetical protein